MGRETNGEPFRTRFCGGFQAPTACLVPALGGLPGRGADLPRTPAKSDAWAMSRLASADSIFSGAAFYLRPPECSFPIKGTGMMPCYVFRGLSRL